MGNAITWAEIPVKDFDRAKKFYENKLKSNIDIVPRPIGKWGMLPYEMGKPHGGWQLSKEKGLSPAQKVPLFI